MNDKEAVHPSSDLADDDYRNIEDHETQHKRISQNNNFYTLVEDKLQSSPQLEDENRSYDWKNTNNHEGKLVMTYDNNARSNKLYPRTLDALYIGLNDNGTDRLILKLSTKQVLNTMKYKLVPMPQDLIEIINKTNSFTTKIQINHFESDCSTTQDDHFDNTQVDGQTQFDGVDNSEDESD